MKASLSLFFVLLTLCLAYGVYALTIVSTRIPSTVMVKPAITASVWVTDSDFNNVTSFRAVFRPDRKTGLYVIASTNPGQFFLNILGINQKPKPANITITYSLDPAFKLKGGTPIHVYADRDGKVDITQRVFITSGVVEAYNVPSRGIIYVTIHLDYILKGTKYSPSQVQAWYSEHTFTATINSVFSSTKITDDGQVGDASQTELYLIQYLVTVSFLLLASVFLIFKFSKKSNKFQRSLNSSQAQASN